MERRHAVVFHFKWRCVVPKTDFSSWLTDGHLQSRQVVCSILRRALRGSRWPADLACPPAACFLVLAAPIPWTLRRVRPPRPAGFGGHE
ncbi:hypothetical protein E2C01_094604 [Portunus trituberculatus]|uniref:Uncharacterized protein n=1 Tax=Portunus trituberculatus TaxID=210409 RepID=A0A5B7K3L4_PORTR|nr:hypothetical protein [Portunus trituberculatus]